MYILYQIAKRILSISPSYLEKGDV